MFLAKILELEDTIKKDRINVAKMFLKAQNTNIEELDDDLLAVYVMLNTKANHKYGRVKEWYNKEK